MDSSTKDVIARGVKQCVTWTYFNIVTCKNVSFPLISPTSLSLCVVAAFSGVRLQRRIIVRVELANCIPDIIAIPDATQHSAPFTALEVPLRFF